MSITKIALHGDSLVDTLFFGGKFWDLELLLKDKFPQKTYEILNYGVGSTDAELGLKRLTADYEYKERARHLPALVTQKPDIVILGDFAYNHWTDSPANLDRYNQAISSMIETIQAKTSAQLWLYASMVPNKKLYVTGIPWLGWDEQKRQQEYSLTRLYQDEFLKLAGKTNLPLIDCHTPSLKQNEGDPQYISNVDFIHPSAATRKLVASLIVDHLVK